MTFRDHFDLKQAVSIRETGSTEWRPGRVRLVGRRKVVVAVLHDDGRFSHETDITREADIRAGWDGPVPDRYTNAAGMESNMLGAPMSAATRRSSGRG